MAARNLRNTSEPTTTTIRVNSEMRVAVPLGLPLTWKAMPVATGASSRPIRATMVPMAAGGRTMFSQLRPAKRMIRETALKITPAMTNPPRACWKPTCGLLARVMQVMVGAMKAKLEPRKAGALPRQTNR